MDKLRDTLILQQHILSSHGLQKILRINVYMSTHLLTYRYFCSCGQVKEMSEKLILNSITYLLESKKNMGKSQAKKIKIKYTGENSQVLNGSKELPV